MKKIIALALALILCCSLAACGSSNKAYPSKPVELVIPASAGGGSDLMGRLLVQIIQDEKLCDAVIHPVGGRRTGALSLDLAGLCDRTAVKQEFFC